MINPIYLDYASVGFEELHAILCSIDMSITKCKHPDQDVVAHIKSKLLSK